MITKVTKKSKSSKLPKVTKKNTSPLPASEDFSALDSAVSELAKQTEALLGKSGEKMRKPKAVLPKKSRKKIPHKKGVSFDIIHDAAKSGKSSAILKAAHPGQKLLEPPHSKAATGSVVAQPDIDAKTPSQDPAEVITTHNAGSLKIGLDSARQVDASAKELPAEPDKPSATGAVPAEEAPAEEVVPTPEPGEDTQSKDEPAKDAPLAETAEPSEQPAHSEVEEEPATATEPDQPDAKPNDTLNLMATDPTQGVQIYNDNLTEKDANSDSEDANAPAIFDTDEYHPPLHDWSKLDRSSRLPVVVLLLLTAVLAAGVYMVVAGVAIPFL